MHAEINKHYIICFYQNTAQEPGKQSSLDLVAVISGGVLFALLALFVVVVITVISCWCTKKRKQVAIRNQQRLLLHTHTVALTQATNSSLHGYTLIYV